ncbi:Hypothetical predicted protein [Olea europaea subsp. europaea]|uniref:Uncharacterized protein n=1 Tax=Olea europaea subsp. europaea TaxID=158383 RepID=A0A8S0QTZ1_OLEEU|nr:Hypothetical predicted protein [Olea europaea subsp. europaea]
MIESNKRTISYRRVLPPTEPPPSIPSNKGLTTNPNRSNVDNSCRFGNRGQTQMYLRMQIHMLIPQKIFVRDSIRLASFQYLFKKKASLFGGTRDNDDDEDTDVEDEYAKVEFVVEEGVEMLTLALQWIFIVA